MDGVGAGIKRGTERIEGREDCSQDAKNKRLMNKLINYKKKEIELDCNTLHLALRPSHSKKMVSVPQGFNTST